MRNRRSALISKCGQGRTPTSSLAIQRGRVRSLILPAHWLAELKGSHRFHDAAESSAEYHVRSSTPRRRTPRIDGRRIRSARDARRRPDVRTDLFRLDHSLLRPGRRSARLLMLSHLAPARVLLRLGGIEILFAFEPEPEPIHHLGCYASIADWASQGDSE